MKTIKIILLSLLFLSVHVLGQNENDNSSTNQIQKSLNGFDNNELKINLIMAVAGLPELTYERFIADNMGVGLSAAISVDNSQDFKSIILPYYRVYFANKKAAGFFIEGNMTVVTEKSDNYIFEYGYTYQIINST
jgi:hypothetical protein